MNETEQVGASRSDEGLGGGLPWRCFHCDEIFSDVTEAKLHFGARMFDTPACQIDAHKLRELEVELDLYRNEDTDLHREIHALNSNHQIALMRAEEAGYARGLSDGRGIGTPLDDDA